MKNFILTLIIACSIQAQKQKIWTIDEILDFAIKNSHEIQISEIRVENQVQFSTIARAAFDATL